MNSSYLEVANSALMWLACAPGLMVVLYMAYLYFKRSREDAPKIGLTKEQVNASIRAAVATSVGPCFVMLTAMLSLMMYVGGPLAWLRVNFIGSVSYELQGANYAAEGMGLTLGVDQLNLDFLATAAVVMSFGCVGWVVFSALFSDKMETVNMKMAGGNKALVPILGTGALIGVFASMSMDRIVPFGTPAFAVLSSAALMFVIQKYNEKADKQWLKEWGLTICMLFGMIVATGVDSIM